MNLISRFVRDELGATAIEYGLIAALIAVVIITAMTAVGTQPVGDLHHDLEARSCNLAESFHQQRPPSKRRPFVFAKLQAHDRRNPGHRRIAAAAPPPRAYDLASFTIPNFLTAALLAVFVAVRAGRGPRALPAIGWHLLAGLVGLVLGFALFVLGYIGGGDAKLFAVTVLWLGFRDLMP